MTHSESSVYNHIVPLIMDGYIALMTHSESNILYVLKTKDLHVIQMDATHSYFILCMGACGFGTIRLSCGTGARRSGDFVFSDFVISFKNFLFGLGEHYSQASVHTFSCYQEH